MAERLPRDIERDLRRAAYEMHPTSGVTVPASDLRVLFDELDDLRRLEVLVAPKASAHGEAVPG